MGLGVSSWLGVSLTADLVGKSCDQGDDATEKSRLVEGVRSLPASEERSIGGFGLGLGLGGLGEALG